MLGLFPEIVIATLMSSVMITSEEIMRFFVT